MKGIFWNSRGLRDLAKINFLRDIAVEKDLDFIALLETHKRDFTQDMLDDFCGGREFFWHWVPPRGRSGGILLGVNLSAFVVENTQVGDFFLSFSLLKTNVMAFVGF